jgi:hypothetical protein
VYCDAAPSGRNGSWPPAFGSTKSTPPVVAAAAIPSVRASGLTPALVHRHDGARVMVPGMAETSSLVPRRGGQFTSGVHARLSDVKLHN